MSEEWGPWQAHDGKGCPCLGKFVHLVDDEGAEWRGVAGALGGESWNWANRGWVYVVVRYRIKKPRGLTILEERLREVEREDA